MQKLISNQNHLLENDWNWKSLFNMLQNRQQSIELYSSDHGPVTFDKRVHGPWTRVTFLTPVMLSKNSGMKSNARVYGITDVRRNCIFYWNGNYAEIKWYSTISKAIERIEVRMRNIVNICNVRYYYGNYEVAPPRDYFNINIGSIPHLLCNCVQYR